MVLFNCFRKKTQKTPDNEIKKAINLKKNIMKLKEISKDIYDVDAWLDEELGKEGTLNAKRLLKRHGKNITGRYCWMPAKMHV